MKSKQPTQSIRRQRIQRAVASSTAIETGTPVNVLEILLKKQQSRFRHLKLAE